MAHGADPNLRAYYEEGREQSRLDGSFGQLEFLRTKEILRRHLPPPGVTVADIGGGPGQYSIWLGDEGYRVVHRDIIPLHVEQTIAVAKERGISLESAVGDARSLDMADESVDAVLVLGPLYHLPSRSDRVMALREAHRVVRQGGPVFVAAISRWAPLLDGILVNRMYREYPEAVSLLGDVEATGILQPLAHGGFSGYCHRPEELLTESREAGLEHLDLVLVEGLGFALLDLDERWANPEDRERVLDAARRIERVPELLGLGPHLILTARRTPTEEARVPP
jgi:SAM-dependent methyltransferase